MCPAAPFTGELCITEDAQNTGLAVRHISSGGCEGKMSPHVCDVPAHLGCVKSRHTLTDVYTGCTHPGTPGTGTVLLVVTRLKTLLHMNAFNCHPKPVSRACCSRLASKTLRSQWCSPTFCCYYPPSLLPPILRCPAKPLERPPDFLFSTGISTDAQ